MTVKTQKRPDESFDNMLKRFSRRIYLSGVLTLAKKKRYFQRKKTKLERKEAALRKKEVEEKIKLSEKTGMISKKSK